MLLVRLVYYSDTAAIFLQHYHKRIVVFKTILCLHIFIGYVFLDFFLTILIYTDNDVEKNDVCNLCI
jgi:hypothetical protein